MRQYWARAGSHRRGPASPPLVAQRPCSGSADRCSKRCRDPGLASWPLALCTPEAHHASTARSPAADVRPGPTNWHPDVRVADTPGVGGYVQTVALFPGRPACDLTLKLTAQPCVWEITELLSDGCSQQRRQQLVSVPTYPPGRGLRLRDELVEGCLNRPRAFAPGCTTPTQRGR